MSYGIRQFLVTDPGGNIIRIGQPLAASEAVPGPRSRLERALDAANQLLYSKGDRQTAARANEDALARPRRAGRAPWSRRGSCWPMPRMPSATSPAPRPRWTR